MKAIRILTLSGAAMLLLGGAANAATPSAKERAETRDLNLQQSQAAQQSNAALPQNANSVAHDAAAGLAVNAPPAAAPTMAVQSAAVAPVAATPLNTIANPPGIIANANVTDDKGTVVGAVQKVEMDSSGKPDKVEIALLGSQQIIVMDAARLNYDAGDNVLTASLDKSQIVEMPAAPQG